MSDAFPIEILNESECGRIVELVGPVDWQHRLEELGLRVGHLVRLVKRGDPCIIAIHNQRISLRCECGSMVLVETVASQEVVENPVADIL